MLGKLEGKRMCHLQVVSPELRLPDQLDLNFVPIVFGCDLALGDGLPKRFARLGIALVDGHCRFWGWWSWRILRSKKIVSEEFLYFCITVSIKA